MQLESFEKLANKHGLVLMLITQSFAPYDVDTVAGFPPDTALRLFSCKAAVPIGEDGQPIEIPADAPETGKTLPVSFAVEIPKDWEQLHYLQRVRIAKDIRGTGESLTVAEADEVIRAEVQRRSE